MKKALLALAVGFSALSSSVAADPSQAFGTCLIDSLTGKERKTLSTWIFFSMGAHPEISQFASISDDQKVAVDKQVGTLITRLLSEDCPQEFKAAQQINPMAVQGAFELVGQVAMQELMTNNKVMEALTSYSAYTDQEKIMQAVQ